MVRLERYGVWAMARYAEVQATLNDAQTFISGAGAGIHDGDLLIVDRSLNADDGKIVIAVLEGELTVKRLSLKNGTVALVAENPDFPPIKLKEGQEITIWGVVTNVIHKV